MDEEKLDQIKNLFALFQSLGFLLKVRESFQLGMT